MPKRQQGLGHNHLCSIVRLLRRAVNMRSSQHISMYHLSNPVCIVQTSALYVIGYYESLLYDTSIGYVYVGTRIHYHLQKVGLVGLNSKKEQHECIACATVPRRICPYGVARPLNDARRTIAPA